MEMFECGTYTDRQRRMFSEIVFSYVSESCRVILDAMVSLGLPLDSIESEAHVQIVYEKEPYLLQSITPDLHSAIATLTKDQGFRTCLRRHNEYQLYDNIDL